MKKPGEGAPLESVSFSPPRPLIPPNVLAGGEAARREFLPGWKGDVR